MKMDIGMLVYVHVDGGVSAMIAKTRSFVLVFLFAPLLVFAHSGVYLGNPGVGSAKHSDIAVSYSCQGGQGESGYGLKPSDGLVYCSNRFDVQSAWDYPPRGGNYPSDKIWIFTIDGSNDAHCADGEAVIYHMEERSSSGRIGVEMLGYCEQVP